MCQSTLLEFILTSLAISGNPTISRGQWLVQWLCTTAVGAAVYAFSTGFLAVLTCVWCRQPLAETTRDTKAGEQRVSDTETGLGQTCVGKAKPCAVTCVVATFNAWLFADSDALWAVLVSEIFNQVGSCEASKRFLEREAVTFLEATAVDVCCSRGGRTILRYVAVHTTPLLHN